MATPDLIVQTDDGDVVGANGYLAVADFKTYADDREFDYTSYTNDNISAAIIRATDYIDTRFRYKGVKLAGASQTTMWPRTNLVDAEGNSISEIHVAVLRACAEYSQRALSTALYVDAPPPSGGRPIIQETATLGPMSTSTTYASPQVMTITLGEYPAADRLLLMAGLIRTVTAVDR